jgi:ABC-2 type transport system permease protein
MTSQNVFIPLVKHELKWRRNMRKNRRRMPRGWRLTYAAFFLILVLGFTTYGSLNGNIHLEGTWYFTWGLPFMIFGISINRVNREWQNETIGWWLSLPYSRSKLITTKFVASLLMSLLMCIVIFILVTLFGLYVMLLNGNPIGSSEGLFLLSGLKWFLLLIAVSPFAASFGTFMGTLAHTKARPALPLLWVFFWVMFPIMGMSGINFDIFNERSIGFPFTEFIILPILISWILAYILVRLSAYLLDRHLTL